MGGGSVQIAFAVPDEEVVNAPQGYIVPIIQHGRAYNVYVHSYLG